MEGVPELSERFSVQYLPTFVVLENGKEVERIVGAVSEEELAEAVS